MGEPNRYQALKQAAACDAAACEAIRDLCTRMTRGDVDVAALVGGLQPISNDLRTNAEHLERMAAEVGEDGS